LGLLLAIYVIFCIHCDCTQCAFNKPNSIATMAVLRVLLCVVTAAASANGFVKPSPSGAASTKLHIIKTPLPIPLPKSISYGEESRKYRRTVYTHDDWVKHRAPDRYVRNTFSIIASGIYKNIAAEILAITGIAAFVVVWNSLCGTYTDFSGVQHPGIFYDSVIPMLTLPMAPFSLLNTSLGLLLGK
jgi:hypothetical protein